MRFVLLLISSVLYTLSFPKLNLWGLSFVALVPFFAVLDSRGSLFKRAVYGLSWGGMTSVGMGYWLFFTLLNHYGATLTQTILFLLCCLILPVSLLYLGFVLVSCFLHQNRLFFYAWVLPSIWVLIESAKEVIPGMLPWGGIGYSLISFFSFIQIADLVGIHGVTFLTVMVNSLLWYGLKQLLPDTSRGMTLQKGPGRVMLPILIVVMGIVGPAVYGRFKINQVSAEVDHRWAQNKAIPAVLVQGNFSEKDRWNPMRFETCLARHLKMTQEGREKKTRLILWPETVLNASAKINDALFLKIIRFIGKDSLLISGGVYRDRLAGSVFNSAYFIFGSGRVMRYDKRILLPYAETSSFLNFLDPYLTAPSKFQAGQGPACLPTGYGKVGVSICFELLYSELIRESVKDGARFLVNLSNDVWFGDSPMPYYQLNAARVRAIENRRFLLRASNSGISAIISPEGRLAAHTRLFVRERLDGEFVPMNQMTLYTRLGNLVLYFAIFLLLAALFRMVLKKGFDGSKGEFFKS